MLILVSAMALLAIIAIIILAIGQVHGVEFSPGTFQRRDYMFFQIPGLDYQITPAWRTDRTKGLETHLRKQGWLSSGKKPDRWDIVWVSEMGRVRQGDPIILTRYLDMYDENDDQRWLTWTNDHPELAGILWSAVQDAAILNAYVVLPDLFELAETAAEPLDFQRSVANFLGHRFDQLGDEQSDAARTEEGARLHKAAENRRTGSSPE